MSKNLIIIGTGSSILKYKQKIKWWSEKYDVMAWGMSYLYCHSNDITPKYFSYLDPHSATKSLDLLKNNSETTSIIYGNIVDQNYKTQQEYIGTSQLISPYSPKNQHEKIYKQYTNKLNYINKKIIPATTIKKLKKDGVNYDWDHKDAALRFKDRMILGMVGNNHKKNVHTEYMDLYENKLTMAILPLVYRMGYKNIFLLGFDGKGGRFFDLKQGAGIQDIQYSYKKYIPYWISWRKYHNMKFFTLNSANETILSNFIECIEDV